MMGTDPSGRYRTAKMRKPIEPGGGGERSSWLRRFDDAKTTGL